MPLEKHVSKESPEAPSETDQDTPGVAGSLSGAPAGSLIAAATRQLTKHASEPLASGLYLVATPIGNLGDITLRALSVLAEADVIYCEDTRHSARLLHHYAIRNETRPFHDHNEDTEKERVLRDLSAGKRVALISDAGTPLISDPGFKLVRACAAAGFPVMSIPGPSSGVAALAASGLATDCFFFAGFLPPRSQARCSRLAEFKSIPGSLIVFEAPQRLAESLADMAAVLGARDAVVARELTKLHEELARGTLDTLAARFDGADVKGEIVIVIGPAEARAPSDDEIAEKLRAALQTMSLKDAAKAVSDVVGVPKSRVYDLGLKVKDGGS
jgi:16S rRNA (cytidine1402-2'-O)-methyltransferase